MTDQHKRAIKVIFFTVFLDLVGFGIILPLSPYLARHFSASPIEIGILMAVYSLMQFLFSPMWGSLSDRFGRRPIILMSLLGSSFSYVLFAFATHLHTLFLARALAGFFAANIAAAQAYIADVTPKEKRSVAMGLIGAAFGLGFIMGPALAGLTGRIGQELGSEPPFGIQFSALVSAGLNALNFIFAYFFLVETLDKKISDKPRRTSRWQSFAIIFRHPQLRGLLSVFFLTSLAMALMEVMVFPFVEDRFNWDYETASLSFAYVGIMMVITQGYFIRKWIPRYGEKKVLFWGILAMAVSFVGIGLSFSIWVLAAVMTLLAIGNGCMRPPVVGLTSVIADEDQQGYAMGVMNSMSAIGRVVGPLLGGWFYQVLSESAPFYASGVITFLALGFFLTIVKSLPNPQNQTAP